MGVAHSYCNKLLVWVTQPAVQIIGSPHEDSFQLVISMLLTSCLFQQAALSSHDGFKPDLHSFLYNGILASRKSSFGWRQARLGGL